MKEMIEGFKKFHLMLAEAHISNSWLTKLLSECEAELNKGRSTPYQTGTFLDRSFGLDFATESRIALGKYIKSGKYKEQLQLYRPINKG